MGSVSGHCSHYGGPTLPPDHLLEAPDTIARGSGFKVNVRETETRSHCRWGDDASTPTFRWKVCVTQGFRRRPRSHRGHREPWVGGGPEAQPSFLLCCFSRWNGFRYDPGDAVEHVGRGAQEKPPLLALGHGSDTKSVSRAKPTLVSLLRRPGKPLPGLQGPALWEV